MIKNVNISSKNIKAGENIRLEVTAEYPIRIVVKCFITDPPPTRFADCQEAGIHVFNSKKPFFIQTSEKVFERSGIIEIDITDAEKDTQQVIVRVTNNMLTNEAVLA